MGQPSIFTRYNTCQGQSFHIDATALSYIRNEIEFLNTFFEKNSKKNRLFFKTLLIFVTAAVYYRHNASGVASSSAPVNRGRIPTVNRRGTGVPLADADRKIKKIIRAAFCRHSPLGASFRRKEDAK